MRARGQTHGDIEPSFRYIGESWSHYISTLTVVNNRILIEPRDVAHMMLLLKIARAQFGDPNHQEHYADEAGYAAIAGSQSK